MAGYTGLCAPINEKVMALGLARNRLIDRGMKQIVGLACPERRAQIGGILLGEGHIEGANGGDAHAIAKFAEIMRERGDEAKSAAGFRDSHIASGPARAVGDVV